MFTQTVRELEKDGLITHTIFPVVPPKVEYKLSPKGKSLNAILRQLDQWRLDNSKNSLIRFNIITLTACYFKQKNPKPKT